MNKYIVGHYCAGRNVKKNKYIFKRSIISRRQSRGILKSMSLVKLWEEQLQNELFRVNCRKVFEHKIQNDLNT